MKHKTSQAGFTLIELIAVMVILGILAAVIIPRITTLTSGAYESNVRSMYGVIKNEVNAQAVKKAMTGGASGHQETYPEGSGTTTATGNKDDFANNWLKEWVEDYDETQWYQLNIANHYGNGNGSIEANELSNAIVFGYFPHGVLDEIKIDAGTIETGKTSTDLLNIYWIYYAPMTTQLGNDEGLDFDGFFMAAFKDDNDGDFEPTFAQAADADDVEVTENGDTEIDDLHWITVKKP
jgi:prepilin-type N-terminal cleavage/methylation domain-containing protein